jgi:hypothetical protein
MQDRLRRAFRILFFLEEKIVSGLELTFLAKPLKIEGTFFKDSPCSRLKFAARF